MGLVVFESWRARAVRVSWRRLALELSPMLALSGAAAFMSAYTQRAAGAMETLARIPLLTRLERIPLAYVKYLELTFWPSDLIFLYRRRGFETWQWLLAAVALGLLTGALWRWRAKCHHALHGWLAFGIALSPVIGVVQVGAQFVADRYLYLPHHALLAGVVLSVPGRWVMARPRVTWALGLGVCACMAVLFARQLRVWENTDTLYGHALEVDPGAPDLCVHVGFYLFEAGRFEEAAPCLKASMAGDAFSEAMLGAVEIERGHHRSGIALLQEAERRTPRDAYVTHVSSVAMVKVARDALAAQRPDDARRALSEALRLDPGNGEARALLQSSAP